jgi:hypothetical protein
LREGTSSSPVAPAPARARTRCSSGNLHIGIAHPLLRPGRVQTLRVRRLGGDAARGAEVAITHLVVDGAVVGMGH